jgi:hypothetical protein
MSAIRCAFRATQVSWLTRISVMPRSSHNRSSSDRSRAGGPARAEADENGGRERPGGTAVSRSF